jgi:hypothetical protein
MNKRLENKLTMYEGLQTLFTVNGETIAKIASFPPVVAEFGGLLTEIKGKWKEASSATAGKSGVKYNAEDELIAVLIPVTSALFLFAGKTKNIELQTKVTISVTQLRRMRDTELALFGSTISDIAAANSAGIAEFGITAEKIAALRAKAEAYSAAIGGQERGGAERKVANMNLGELFTSADDLLNNKVDHFMELLPDAGKEFYDKYFLLRVVKDTGVRHNKPDAPPTPPAK